MPLTYKRKSNRASYSEEVLQRALEDVRSGRLSKLAASRQYGIPRSTIRKRLKSNDQPKSLGRFRLTFSENQENELLNYVKKMDNMFHGLTMCNLRKIAFDYAQVKNISNRFNQEAQLAGKV
jgi:hypothetical protein